jgi:hypothetical protein
MWSQLITLVKLAKSFDIYNINAIIIRLIVAIVYQNGSISRRTKSVPKGGDGIITVKSEKRWCKGLQIEK